MTSFCPYCCIVAFVLLMSKIYFIWATKNSYTALQYKSSLNKDLQKTYNDIVTERSNISMKGYFCGIVISVIIISYLSQIKKVKTNRMVNACLVIIIVSFVHYFYYMLSKKNKWMLEYIGHDQKLVDNWLKMYRFMQFHYHLGFVFGIFAAGFFALSFKC